MIKLLHLFFSHKPFGTQLTNTMSTKAPNLVSTAISLPKLRIASKSNGYELRLHALLSLDLPEELRTLVTAEELLNAVTEKHLWIARKGACHLNISVSVHDELLRGHAELPQIAAWVQECEVCASICTVAWVVLIASVLGSPGTSPSVLGRLGRTSPWPDDVFHPAS